LPPSLINLPAGCKFHPRCGYVLDRCVTEEPGLVRIGAVAGHSSACWLPAEAAGVGASAEQLREQVVSEGRHGAAVQVAEAIAASPEVA
jgi:hypothetical protein